ncbi:MAG: helix-turn-helix domain-containing protein, partial [bacterium]|nr:helix-turn-helix domain-containing protein [bacterium]
MTSPLNENLITTKEAGELFGYTSDYISRLVRSGKITGKRIGHNWLIEKESLVQFLDTQGNNKVVRAHTLARARAEEYRAHHSLLHRTTKALTTPIQVSQFGIGPIGHPMSDRNIGKTSFLSHALALSVALLVIVGGALAAQAAAISQLADVTASLARETAFGFSATFGGIPHHIVARIDAAKNEVEKISPRVATLNEIATANIVSSVLADPDLSALRMVLGGNQNVRIATQLSGETPKLLAVNGSVVTADDVRTFVLNTYSLATSPSRAASAFTNAYVVLGENAYTGIGAAFTMYDSLIGSTAEKVLALAAT